MMDLHTRVDLTRFLSRYLLLGLVIWLTLSNFWLYRPHSANPWVIWMIQALPLIAFLPNIFRGNNRAHVWLCFVILVYFCTGVIAATVPELLIKGLLEAVVSLTLFTTAMFYARWNSQLQRRREASAS